MTKLDTKILLKMLESAKNNMSNEMELINNLNVFPVPDGDTGSNMSSTLTAAFDKVKSFSHDKSASALWDVFAKESLLGARGNSGVILSQIFKGFTVGIKGKKTLVIDDIVKALKCARETAYKSVIKPVEGTILTVIKDTSIAVTKLKKDNLSMVQFFEALVASANKSLDNTPNLLPILKEVGVVDSGGKGLVVIFEGMLAAIKGKVIESKTEDSNTKTSIFLMKKEVFDGEFGFCTEFIINIPTKNTKNEKKNALQLLKSKPFNKKHFMDFLKKQHSSSEVVVRDDEILKVHCHVGNPIKVLTHVQRFGEFIKVKVENMNTQASSNSVNPNNTNVGANITDAKIAIISCNNGQGIIEDIKNYGAHFIIEGGQTMNPSAGDFVSAIKTLNAKEIIILPNNSNVILAAKQAAKTTKGKKVTVLPTKTQIQGMVAMIQYNNEESLKDNLSEMKEAISEVKSISIAKAIRTTRINKVKIKNGEYMGILDGKIILCNKSKVKAAIELIKKNVNEMSEIITIYVGMDASIGDGKEISTVIEGECDIEVIIKNGGQPTYEFLISIE